MSHGNEENLGEIEITRKWSWWEC